MKSERDIKGIWIPIEIWEEPTLTPFERMLLAEIDSIDTGKGCFKSRESLAERMCCSVGHIKNTVSRLSKNGWIVFLRIGGRHCLRTRFSRHCKVTYKLPSGNVKMTPPSPIGYHYRDSREKTYSGDRRNGGSPSLNLNDEKKIHDVAPFLVRIFFEKFVVPNRYHIGVRHLNKQNKPRTEKKWIQSINVLIQRQDQNVEKIKRVMKWYFKHHKDEWVGTYHSMTSFVDNFDKIEKAMRRAEQPKAVMPEQKHYNINGVEIKRKKSGWVEADPDQI